jgi:prephenate dehydrogenase
MSPEEPSASESASAEPAGTAADGPVLVVGVGLIGASVGMALRRAGVDTFLRDADPTAAHVAASRGAGSDAPAPADVRLVVVATPPDHLSAEIEAALKAYPGAVVTDVGSVKAKPLAALVDRGVDLGRYVGGHPMAGSERTGPLASAPDLFDGRTWAVVARDDALPDAVAQVEWLATTCGALVVRMETDDHDLAVARISHLPHLVAALTAGQLSLAPEAHLALSGQGIRDVTRIAAGDPALWRQIIAANAVPLTELLLAVRAGLDDLVDSLTSEDHDRLEAVLAAGAAGTAVIPGKHGGPSIELAAVTVAIPDEPGALARLFADTGAAGVNIEDIRIDHDPARAFGLVELDVSLTSADQLVDALRARDWSAHR